MSRLDRSAVAGPGPAAQSPVLVGAWCGHCGEPMGGDPGSADPGSAEPVPGLAPSGPLNKSDHAICGHRLALEPPRFCATCRRRLVVQVLPRGWTARCTRHGDAATS